MSVVSIQMERDSRRRKQLTKWRRVKREQKRTKDRTLWYTGGKGSRKTIYIVDKNSLSSVSEIGRNKVEGSTRDSIVRRQPSEKDIMVDSVKCSR